MTATLRAAQTMRDRVPDACPLTPHELSAIRGLAGGMTYQQIAQKTGRSHSTVRHQLHSAYGRLGVTGSLQAVIRCLKEGWATVDDTSVDESPATAGDLRAVSSALHRLAHAVRQDQKSELTATERAYLHAFDDLLYARDDDDEIIAARAAMTQAFGPLLDQAGVPRVDRPRRDLVERLVSEVQANRSH